MNEEEAYGKLQELLALVDDLIASGHYTTDEIKQEIDIRTGMP